MRGVVVGRTLVALVSAVGLTIMAAPAADAHGGGGPKGHALTCTGGEIGSGTYSRIKVTGPCSVASGAVVRVRGDIRVEMSPAAKRDWLMRTVSP